MNLNAEKTCLRADVPIAVSGGLITGVLAEDGSTLLYKGIPFAAPPVGEFRWKAPQPVENWSGVKACDAFPKICLQGTVAHGDFQKEFYSDPYPAMSEDCLYLNVWTPAKSADEKLPVMVYIHGGGNGSGWSFEKEFDGKAIAAHGCILVTITYRLSIFGFFAHEELAAEANGCSGNYGLMDQIAALRWVKDNIAAFGGDPDNITMFGQSAGAMDITILTLSAKMKGLVKRAILQSGGYLNVMPTVPLAEAEAKGAAFVRDLGKTSISELRAMSGRELYDAFAAAGGSYTGLCVDGWVINEPQNDLFAKGALLDISYMIGSNSDEFGGTFAAGVPLLGDKLVELGRSPAYCYEFTHFMPGVDDPKSVCYGAFHTAECWYIFKTLDRCWRKPLLTGADDQLADLMCDYWTNFAKTGNPNGATVPEWKPYTAENPNVQILDVKE